MDNSDSMPLHALLESIKSAMETCASELYDYPQDTRNASLSIAACLSECANEIRAFLSTPEEA